MMTPGISTACFYPRHTEQVLCELAALKIQSVEIFINCMEELSSSFVKNLKKIADSQGVKILSIHPFTSAMEYLLFFSDYDRRFNEGLELYKKYYEAANLLGAEIVVFHGAFHDYPWEMEEYFERFSVMVKEAKKHGANLCHENVSRCISRDPIFFEKLSSAVPEAGFVLDIKQARRAGADVFDFIKAMGENLRHVHISDHDHSNICLSPGKGIFNIHFFLETLRKNRFEGGVIVELYRENFRDIVEIQGAYQHLLKLISTVQ